MGTPYSDTRHLPVVYYLADKGTNAIKIGTTRNLAARMARHKLKHPGVELEYLAWEYGDETLERRRHFQFADINICGEWFFPMYRLTRHIHDVRQETADGEPQLDPLAAP